MTEPRTTCDLPHPHGAEYRLVGTECPWHDWTLIPADGEPPWNRIDPWFNPKAWALEKAKRKEDRERRAAERKAVEP